MKKGKVTMAVEVIVDNSGSMQIIKADVVKGLNEFIAQLATALTPVTVGITLFGDTLRQTIIDGVPVYEMPRLRNTDYNPSLPTEDIAMSVIQGLEVRLAPIDAFQKVLVVITDGLNSSPSMNRAKAEIAKRQKEGWLILWLGADQSGGYNKAIMDDYARRLGIPDGLIFSFNASNFSKAMPLAAQAALRFSGLGDAKAAEFTKEERAKA